MIEDNDPACSDETRLLTNPSELFGYSLTRMMDLTQAQIEPIQLAALKLRFAQYKGSLPMLDKLADRQGIDVITSLDDVVPLLFDHATYKSYPPSLLDKHRYADLTAWLNKLTTLDLSSVDVSHCHSIDEWMMALSAQTPLSVVHTSGTSGTMSFLPWAKAEFRSMASQFAVLYFQQYGKPAPSDLKLPLNIECVYPYFRSGGLSHCVLNDSIVEVIAGGENHFHAAYPGRLSADLARLASRLRAAEAAGKLDEFKVSEEMSARRREFEAQQRSMPMHLDQFFSKMGSDLAGQQIFMLATSNLLFSLAEGGLKRGLRQIFSPSSVIVTGGGGKGATLPADWRDHVRDFFGAQCLHATYGMSEMTGQFQACEHDHYHVIPWIIPFVLDSETGKPLPRRGTVTGRFAFYDLLPSTRWGGFVTGDEVTLAWDTPCACGRAAPYLHSTIQRFSDKKTDAGEEKLNCAASSEAYAEALEFLNGDVV